MNLLLEATVVSSLFLVTQAEAESDWICIAPDFSSGPIPPVLPDSYHMVFEVNDLVGKKRHTDEVWYDWPNQRARIREVDDSGVAREIVSFYNSNTGFRYSEGGKQSVDGDVNRLNSCAVFKLSEHKNTPLFEKGGRPLNMVDVYQSLLFGGKYQFAFMDSVADATSRFIKSNRFTSCITDRVTGRRLNVTYHWTLDGKSPIRFEIDGGALDGDNNTEYRIRQVASVLRFDRDPEMDNDLFVVPRDLKCSDDPRIIPVDEFPQLSQDFAWREETLFSARDQDGRVLANETSIENRQIYSSRIFGLVRMDWIPTLRDGKMFQDYIGKPITVIADVFFKAIFIIEKNTGSCSVLPMAGEFALIKQTGTASFDIREPLDLLGMTTEHVEKGEYVERGSRVTVFSDIDEAPDGTIEVHEATFRYDEELSQLSNGAFIFVPTSQLNRKFFAAIDERTKAFESTEKTSYFDFRADYAHLDVFEAAMCVANRKRRFFRISFRTDFKEVIYGNGYEFLNRLRDMIARTGNLGTVMRVQKLKMLEDFEKNRIHVSMTLLEPFPELVNAIQTTVDSARDEIVRALNDRQLAVPIEWQGGTNTIVPEAGSFVELELSLKERTTPPKMLETSMYSAELTIPGKSFLAVSESIYWKSIMLEVNRGCREEHHASGACNLGSNDEKLVTG
ncbi:uncharacterized protein LOC100906792 [Galendromus occidentalis]|uniref:Uncharacterized protein LOC100906792 n=1 Tax=Galendromus occidentalis TaxID=34638 RepID=A0AAJ6VYC9_9ACAR|nr:uncharacterized protein LOC100906792 [Galendromus occidentalis]